MVRIDFLHCNFLSLRMLYERVTTAHRICDLKLQSDQNMGIHISFFSIFFILHMYFSFPLISFSFNDFSVEHVPDLYCSSCMECLNLLAVNYVTVRGTKAFFHKLHFLFFLPSILGLIQVYIKQLLVNYHLVVFSFS